VEKYGTDGQTTDDYIVRLIRYSCWINKATDKHPEYATLNARPRQQ